MKKLTLVLALVLLSALAFGAGGGESAEDGEKVINIPGGISGGTYFDWMKTVYNRTGQPDLVQIPLTTYDNNYTLHNVAAKNLEVSDDGLTWTITLIDGLLWSDGTQLTARDYVFALERAVTQGYDFGWYWSWAAGIANWSAVESGDKPLSEFGVKQIDDKTIQVTTTAPKPYMPGIVSVWFPVPEHQVEKYGDEYATKAETMLSSGPYILTEWIKGDKFVMEKNPDYVGPWAPKVDKIVGYPTLQEAEVGFAAYLAGDIDRTGINVGQLALANEKYPEEIKSNALFAFYYISYDYESEPFNNIDVRKALFYSINREEMTSTVLRDLAAPARTICAPGFPGYSESIAAQSTFDPDKAREYLAKAGYAGGEGFPKVTFLWRQEGGATQVAKPMAEYLQAQWKTILGIDVELRSEDVSTWMQSLTNTKYEMYLSPYAFDYIDASNFYNIFVTPGSRHNWINEEYNALVAKANATFDWEDRAPLYEAAEQIIVDEAAVVNLAHPLQHSLVKPYIGGAGMAANDFGFYPMLIYYTWSNFTIDK